MTFWIHDGARARNPYACSPAHVCGDGPAREGRGVSSSRRNTRIFPVPTGRGPKSPSLLMQRDVLQGRERRRRGGGVEGVFDKICRGKYLAWSSQSFIKVNWPVERTRSAPPSITCPIVSQSLPQRGRPPAKGTMPLHHPRRFEGNDKVSFTFVNFGETARAGSVCLLLMLLK